MAFDALVRELEGSAYWQRGQLQDTKIAIAREASQPAKVQTSPGRHGTRRLATSTEEFELKSDVVWGVQLRTTGRWLFENCKDSCEWIAKTTTYSKDCAESLVRRVLQANPLLEGTDLVKLVPFVFTPASEEQVKDQASRNQRGGAGDR